MGEENAGSKLSNMFRALSSRNYKLFFVGQGISLIGTWMQQVALSWLVYRLTDSVFLLGAVTFSSQIPSFLLGPFAGVLADKFNRHKVLLVTQALSMLQATTLAILVLTNTIAIWHVLALSAFLGIINAFDIATRQAFVIELVEKRDNISNAIALNSSMFNMARLVGPTIAGLIIAAVGEGMCILINAISYLAVIGSLLLMRLKPFERVAQERKVWESLKDGFQYAFGFPPIRALIIIVGLLSLFGMPFTVLLPVFARDILQGGANTLGYLMGASGLGALSGALFLAQRKSVEGLGKVIIFTMLLFGFALIAFSFSEVLLLSLVLMLFSGFGMIVTMASCNTLLQTIVDDDKRGRVMSLYATAFMGTAPIGSMLAGSVAEYIGVAYTLAGCGLLCAVSIIPFAVNRPKLRRMVQPIYERLGIVPEIATGLQAASSLTNPNEEE
ncbi:putative MFS family arabinose efflux permease [Pontibacter ummariensis]|uniref:Predicted arabinose efflux permease, MFS family n=1 Tax=Pontibacter ummariensis TaxID=1610492 RepID=A0A239BCE6_9BACT|nr:MFS transporter [Pontibacter ummariensis]PRY16419.1 putative MFS family arabinose efflux permease [Pontibacter ummariensis]SNS04834.1 Predicted arabinose efflux permease, MFS family [Pontibacter ummariensis]